MCELTERSVLLQYTAYVVWCTSSNGGQWEIRKRFKDFRKFRSDLIKLGAGSTLKGVQFPRKTVGRTTSGKTDEKRIPVLQAWLNLVIGVYAEDPALAPHIESFLDLVDGQIPIGARVTASRELAPFEPEIRLLEGDWLARGMNRFAQNKLEEERFSLRLQPDGLTLSGYPSNPDERGDYRLENIKLVDNAASGCVLLEFHQVYKDGSVTGWYSMVDRAHLHLTNGTWMALSGVHEGQRVGSFTADKILDDPSPGPYRVVCQEGVLARDGPEATSQLVGQIELGTEVEVMEVLRRRDGVMRLCFSKAGIPFAGVEPARYTDGTERLWVSERKSDDQSLLLERIDEDEQELAAAGGGGPGAGGETYDLTIVASTELGFQQLTVQLRGVQTVEDVGAQIQRRVPQLQGATDLQFLYSDPDFDGDFLALEDIEDLPLDGTIQVLGTPGPVTAPAVSAQAAELGVPPVAALPEAPVPGEGVTLNLTVGFNLTVNGVTSLDDLVSKLRERIASSMAIPEGGTESDLNLGAHRLEGGIGSLWVGDAYVSLDEIVDGAKVCLKAKAA